LFVFTVCFLFSQETESDIEGKIETENPDTVALFDDDSIFVISGFDFDIKGITRPNAIIYNAELKIGEKLHGQAALDEYIADKTQVLNNRRVLKDNALVTYTVGERAKDGSYPVFLKIKVEDTWNIIAVPRPTYSSNSGFNITIKARDYNFLGTMDPLRLDLGYSHDEEGHNSFTLMLDSDTPFRLFNLDWNFNFDHDFSYRPNLDEPFFYRNTTGLSVEIPYKRTTFSVGTNESLILNQEMSRRYWKEYDRFQKGIYMSSSPYVSWRIPTGFHYYHLGEVNYNTDITATFIHGFSRWPIFSFLKGPYLNFSHSLGFGRVDWVDNFRKGVSANISNSFKYNFYNLRNDINPWGAGFSISGTGHKIIREWFNFSTRLMYRHWFFDDYTDSGGNVVRGIIDNDIIANYMFSVNLDFGFRLFRFRPSVWFKNEKWRIINFDFHVAPFVDLALFNNPRTQEPFGFDNMLLGAGLEAIIFPQAFRSLYLRVSMGLGVKTGDLHAGISREIYIGTDLHY
jgi:hypothetical protein